MQSANELKAPAPTTTRPGSLSLWLTYPLALASIGAVWGSVVTVLAARQLAILVPDKEGSAMALGAVMTMGPLVAMIAQPALGKLCDQTPNRFLGRRNTWILCGSFAAVPPLIGMALSPDAIMLGVFYALAAIPLSGVQVALSAVLPERVPLHRRGSMSAVAGSFTVGGALAGTTVGGLADSTLTGYITVTAALVISCTMFALATRDVVSRPRSALTVADITPRSPALPAQGLRRGYWLAFLGRFFIVLAYFLIAGFNLYLLRDYVSVGSGSTDDASHALVAVSAWATPLMLISSAVAGLLADRLGYLRLLNALGCGLFVPAGLLLIFAPSFPGFLAAQLLTAAGFGCSGTAHQVVTTRVLSKQSNAGRDLGVMGIANAAPQVIAVSIGGWLIGHESYWTLFTLAIICASLAVVSITLIRLPK